uniref:Uncharacterized protein n=1 Tax=Parastrongyloides trichosuri TaxID=131310 RepID=A0A0N4Z6J8_PARTI
MNDINNDILSLTENTTSIFETDSESYSTNDTYVSETTASLYSSNDSYSLDKNDSSYSNCETAKPFTESDFKLMETLQTSCKIRVCIYDDSEYFFSSQKNKPSIEEPQSSYCFGNFMNISENKNINSQYHLKDLVDYKLMKETPKIAMNFGAVESQYAYDK